MQLAEHLSLKGMNNEHCYGSNKCTSDGHHTKNATRNAIWIENDKEIKALLDGKKRVKDI